ncbi:MAG: polymer-forming cytoskeletal protein, partial [Ruminococcaceae bacterium]|nr:polymer-forming cytoskeletal protein [Oscillospiraceae bacterium]
MKKYEFTGETKQWWGRTLHRIRATVSFGNVSAGEVGGWIEKEENLSHEGNAWVYGEAQVYGKAQVYGEAQVWGNAKVWGNAWVYGEALVCGEA